MRERILEKCPPNGEKTIRAVFEKEPFGALERLGTQKLLDVVKRVTRQELAAIMRGYEQRRDDQDVWLFGGSAAAYIKRRLPNG